MEKEWRRTRGSGLQEGMNTYHTVTKTTPVVYNRLGRLTLALLCHCSQKVSRCDEKYLCKEQISHLHMLNIFLTFISFSVSPYCFVLTHKILRYKKIMNKSANTD